MSETTTAQVKNAVLPSWDTVQGGIAAGVAAFGGFALSGYIGKKAQPQFDRLMGGHNKFGPVTSGTVARVATAITANVVHVMTRNTAVGKAGVWGIHVRDLTFFAMAGAMANAFGSLVLDLLSMTGKGTAQSKASSFIATLTGVGTPAVAAPAAA